MSTIRKIARYEILEEKGRGAMGGVYVACALSGPQGHEYRERFFREGAHGAVRLAQRAASDSSWSAREFEVSFTGKHFPF